MAKNQSNTKDAKDAHPAKQPEPAAMQTMVVVEPVRHNGVMYMPGDEVVLPPEVAKQWESLLLAACLVPAMPDAESETPAA